MAKKNDIASVLAFEKKLVPSDGLMYGTRWKTRDDASTTKPLPLREKSVRGTISNRLKGGIKNDPLKLNAEVEKPNLQTVDSCSLNEDQDTLVLKFTLKVLSNIQKPSACNHQEFNKKYTMIAKQYIDEHKFYELARRYAINIANGRFLWRNRVGVSNLEVKVHQVGSDKVWTFDATKISTRHFDIDSHDISTNIKELAEQIASALSGENDFILLDITAYAEVGKAQDVFPSEELVLDKSSSAKGKKSKILYSVNDVAAMHSQKIGNAIRSIDTWYPKYNEVDTGPIAIEPYGAVTNLGIAYRSPSEKSDFFTLFDRWVLEGDLDDVEKKHYVMGVLVRGGVFGESGKE